MYQTSKQWWKRQRGERGQEGTKIRGRGKGRNEEEQEPDVSLHLLTDRNLQTHIFVLVGEGVSGEGVRRDKPTEIPSAARGC